LAKPSQPTVRSPRFSFPPSGAGFSGSLSGDAELIDPTGRWQGIAGLSDRIGNYHSSAPGTTVVPASGVDVHNGIERYAWKIVDPSGIPPSTIRRARGCWTADDRTAADAFARVTSPEDCRQSKR
jgi:hypothetical protein